MNQTYSHTLGEHTSSVLVCPRQGGYYLAFLDTPKEIRNKGCAREVMRKVCAAADAFQVDLWLDIIPLGRHIDGLRLEAFYSKFGFVKMGGSWCRAYVKG